MGEFFKPWRRKIGVMTLVMACILMAGWMRSFANGDVFLLKINGKYFSLRSAKNELQLYEELPIVSFTVNGNNSLKYDQSDNLKKSPIWDTLRSFKQRGFDGLAASCPPNSITGVLRGPYVAFPYWSMTIPLTLISSWLLLSKACKSTPMKTAESIPGKVA